MFIDWTKEIYGNTAQFTAINGNTAPFTAALVSMHLLPLEERPKFHWLSFQEEGNRAVI